MASQGQQLASGTNIPRDSTPELFLAVEGFWKNLSQEELG